MPVSPTYRRDFEDDSVAIALATSDMSLSDHSPFMSFDDTHPFDSNLSDSSHMIFDFDDNMSPYESKGTAPWDPSNEYAFSTLSSTSIPYFPGSPESTTSQLDFGASHLPPVDRSFEPSSLLSSFGGTPPVHPDFNYSHWLTDPDQALVQSSTTAPINIPLSHSHQAASSGSFVAYSNNSSIFPDVSPFSPNTAYAALQPLPRSFSPGEEPPQSALSVSPSEPPLSPPTWASQLWTPSSPALENTSPGAAPPLPLSEDAYATQRPRMSARRSYAPVTQMFQSSSAPSPSHMRPPFSRAYSRRTDSISEHDDGTVRRKKRSLVQEEDDKWTEKATDGGPLRSVLRPPKLAPSAWQLYFTDWIQRHQATSHKKLNVAQAAKEAGQEYARLSSAEKEPYKHRSQAAKEARERDLAAYMRTLTPDDIKRENAYRTAQRKAGKSRKGNIKDPNAPKKPLSAYFMFLQRIRSDPELVHEVFGDETETTKQSVLAAAKWRSMTDDERKPFLAQAEQEKLEYESARKLYEEGTTGYSSSINFSILPGNPINSIIFPTGHTLRPMKREPAASESESEDFDLARGHTRFVSS